MNAEGNDRLPLLLVPLLFVHLLAFACVTLSLWLLSVPAAPVLDHNLACLQLGFAGWSV